MNANDSLERGIADVYEREAPRRAPDWVLAGALDTIESTPQRRVLTRVPWRLPDMNTFAKVAIAAVAVLAVGLVGLNLLSPRSSSGVGGQPTASPSPSPTVDPSAPPALSSTFTSTLHAYSMAYPAGWETRSATQPWLPVIWGFDDPRTDTVYDPVRRDHLFLTAASRPLGAETPEAWIDGIARNSDPGCASAPEEFTIDGADARVCGGLAYVAAGDRAYMFLLYVGGDEPWLGQSYDTDWFKQVLETVRLDPSSASDASPSA